MRHIQDFFSGADLIWRDAELFSSGTESNSEKERQLSVSRLLKER